MNNQSQYPSGAGSLFATMARKAVIKIWSFCQFCYVRTEQVFSRDEGKFEIYVCQSCGQEHKIAVR